MHVDIPYSVVYLFITVMCGTFFFTGYGFGYASGVQWFNRVTKWRTDLITELSHTNMHVINTKEPESETAIKIVPIPKNPV
jgi:hypothetical protein